MNSSLLCKGPEPYFSKGTRNCKMDITYVIKCLYTIGLFSAHGHQRSLFQVPTPGGGGVTAIYGLYRYVPL